MSIDIESLTIKQVREIAAMIQNQSAPTKDEYLGWNIVVLDRGFVYVGNVRTEGPWLVIESAKNIRKWGTENKGLGALANGPLSATILDVCPNIRAYRTEVNHLLAVDASKWNV